MDTGIFNLLSLLVFTVSMIIFPLALWIIAKILGPSNPNIVKNSTYECGQVSTGEAHMRFNIRYYPYAMIYAIFGSFAIFLLLMAPEIIRSKVGLGFSLVMLAIITSALFSAVTSLRFTGKR